jgi:hypothetical protein
MSERVMGQSTQIEGLRTRIHCVVVLEFHSVMKLR